MQLTMRATDIDMADAGRYRRGRAYYRAHRMTQPFLLETLVGLKRYPAGYLVIMPEGGGRLEAVQPVIFERTFFSTWPAEQA